jgi:hypothetical protein
MNLTVFYADSMTEISHSRLVDETGRGYEGDVSHAVDSSTDSAIPTEPLCSPSLGLPNPAPNRSSSPIESPELSYIEETPESIRNARSRAPRTSSAVTKSLPRDACTSHSAPCGSSTLTLLWTSSSGRCQGRSELTGDRACDCISSCDSSRQHGCGRRRRRFRRGYNLANGPVPVFSDCSGPRYVLHLS